MIKKLITLFPAIIITVIICAQAENLAITERLGYPKEWRLLIIQINDAGLSHSINMATISAFEEKAITSASIMVPYPWFYEFVEFAKNHNDLDIGIHLVFSGEWKYYKWDGVLPSAEIPSLIDKNGTFYATSDEVAENSRIAEIKKEARVQIQRAIDFGVNLTHIDTHVGTIFKSPGLIKAYYEIGKESNPSVLMYPGKFEPLPREIKTVAGNQLILTKGISLFRKEFERDESYKKAMKALHPGLNILIVHLGSDNDEKQAVCAGHLNFGSAWRQKDNDYIVSERFKKVLKNNNIYPVT